MILFFLQILYRLYAFGGDKSDFVISILDSDKKELRELARMPYDGSGFNLYPCKQYEFLALHNSKALRFNFDENSFLELFDLSEQGISGWVSFLHEYNNYYILYVDNYSTGKSTLIRMKPVEEYGGLVEVLRLGKFEAGKDFLLDEITTEFNFLNPQYYIEIIDYSKYGDEAAMRFHMDIIKGEAPDILLLSEPNFPINHLPIHQYIAGGALVDIAPYINRDLDLDTLWNNAMQELYTGNSCYIAVPTFSIYTTVGTTSAVSNLIYKNIGDFFSALNKDFASETPQFAINTTQEQFAIDMILTNIEHFIDYNVGTADFNSKEFIELLEAVHILDPVEERNELRDVISLARKKHEIAFIRMRHFGDLQMYAGALDSDFQTIGFPGKHGGSALIPQHIFGISSTTQNTEGAWAFLRMIYEYEDLHRLTGSHFPMNKLSFAQLADGYTAWQEAFLKRGGGYTSY